ncbi:MAG: hypothetical protein KGJ45_11475 [Elusimicrobia bacterium]|nr:hypothetical protein [Elusimicrobiota bacterium]
MVDPAVMSLMTGGGAHLVDFQNDVAGPTAASPVNGVGGGAGGSISAAVATNFGGSLVGGVTLAVAALLLAVYLLTRGRQH